MIVDASAFLAILLGEPEGHGFEDAILEAASRPVMSPMNYLEAAVRVDSLNSEDKSVRFDRLFLELDIELAETTAVQARLAREAYRKFGKGNHKAKLNLGDCFAYALAKAREEPLLFKGNDFTHTDIEPAL